MPEDISHQERISSVLLGYDNLIDNNRRRIALLENTARELYREWFVRHRFPGSGKTAITGGLPAGWERLPLHAIASIVMGQSPESKCYNKENIGLPFHQGVTGFSGRFPRHAVYSTEYSRTAGSGDILFSVRAPVGRLNISHDEIAIGRGLSAIRSLRDQQNFLFYALKSHFWKDDIIGAGSIYAAVTKKYLGSVEILQPADALVQRFTELVKPIDAQIAVLDQAAHHLQNVRDMLLPRLMSERGGL